MDACLKKEQIGTLFVWVGALERGFGGGGAQGFSTPKGIRAIPQKRTPAVSLQIVTTQTKGEQPMHQRRIFNDGPSAGLEMHDFL